MKNTQPINGTLKRFNNAAGVPYSAIYDKNGREIFSCERKYEEDMIATWNKSPVWSGSEYQENVPKTIEDALDFIKNAKFLGGLDTYIKMTESIRIIENALEEKSSTN